MGRVKGYLIVWGSWFIWKSWGFGRLIVGGGEGSLSSEERRFWSWIDSLRFICFICFFENRGFVLRFFKFLFFYCEVGMITIFVGFIDLL